MLKGERQRDFVLTPAGEVEYLSLAPQPLKDAAVLMLDTGLRVGEAVRLTWSDIQLERVGSAAFGYLRVREGKSKNAKRTVPITARVRLMLDARLRECDREPNALVFGIERGTSLDHLHAKVRPQMKKQNRLRSPFTSAHHADPTRRHWRRFIYHQEDGGPQFGHDEREVYSPERRDDGASISEVRNPESSGIESASTRCIIRFTIGGDA